MEADAQRLANLQLGTSAKRWEAAVNLFQTLDPSDRKRFCNDIFVFPEFFARIDVETVYAALSPEKRDELWRMIAEKRGGVGRSAELKAGGKKRAAVTHSPLEQVPAKSETRTKRQKAGKDVVYPPDIKLETIKCALRLKEQGVSQYYKALGTMWNQNRMEWTAGLPLPTFDTVKGWMRTQQALSPRPAPKNYDTGLAKMLKAQAARKREDNDGVSVKQAGFEGAVRSIVAFLGQDKYFQGVLMVYVVNKDTQLALKSDYHVKAAKTFFETNKTLQGRDIAQMLRQLEEGSREQMTRTPAAPVQVEIEFTGMPGSDKRKQQESVIKGDLLASMRNLGDSLGTTKLRLLGWGGFGVVLSAAEQKLALKVIKKLVPLGEVAAAAANELTMIQLSRKLASVRVSGRNGALLPFGPPPPPHTECPGLKGEMIFALPSLEVPGHGYPAIAMRLARCTLDTEARMVSILCFNETHEVKNDGMVRLSSIMKGVFMSLVSIHGLRMAHRDIKTNNMLLYSVRVLSGTGHYVHRSAEGEHMVVVAADFGKGLPFCIQMDTNDIVYTTSEKEALRESMKHLPKPIGPAYGLHLIPESALDPVTGCFPDSRKLLDVKPPRQRHNGWGTTSHSPPESQASPKPGQECLEARNWQSGDMWACGIIMAEIMMGQGKSLGLTTDFKKVKNINDRLAKELFAECTDQVMWSRYLQKSTEWRRHIDNPGEVPAEWHDAIDLLRGLTRCDPNQRFTVQEALEHDFMKLAGNIDKVLSSTS